MDGKQYSPNIRLSRKMDYLSALFYNKERVSKFLREMNHFNARDIIKLRQLIGDFQSDLAYYLRKKREEGRIDLKELEDIEEKIAKKDLFNDPEGYIDLLREKKAELIFLAGKSGLLPDYVKGMREHER